MLLIFRFYSVITWIYLLKFIRPWRFILPWPFTFKVNWFRIHFKVFDRWVCGFVKGFLYDFGQVFGDVFGFLWKSQPERCHDAPRCKTEDSATFQTFSLAGIFDGSFNLAIKKRQWCERDHCKTLERDQTWSPEVMIWHWMVLMPHHSYTKVQGMDTVPNLTGKQILNAYQQPYTGLTKRLSH